MKTTKRGAIIALALAASMGVSASSCEPRPMTQQECIDAGYEWEIDRDTPQGECDTDDEAFKSKGKATKTTATRQAPQVQPQVRRTIPRHTPQVRKRR